MTGRPPIGRRSAGGRAAGAQGWWVPPLQSTSVRASDWRMRCGACGSPGRRCLLDPPATASRSCEPPNLVGVRHSEVPSSTLMLARETRTIPELSSEKAERPPATDQQLIRGTHLGIPVVSLIFLWQRAGLADHVRLVARGRHQQEPPPPLGASSSLEPHSRGST